MTANGHKESLWGDKNVPKLGLVMVSLFCKFTKN